MSETVLDSPPISTVPPPSDLPASTAERAGAVSTPLGASPIGETGADSLLPRRLGDIRGGEDGPTLICLGAIHGNEPAGVFALERVFAELERDPSGLRGRLVGLTGNRKAFRAGQRFLEHDLNRYWQPERVALLRNAEGPLGNEDEELRDLDREMRSIVAEARGPLFALDIHTTSSEGPGFAVLDDTLPNREFALHLPITVVVGLEEELSGTVTHHIHDLGMRVFGFEAGQHDDPESVDHAAAAVWIALEASGVLEEGSRSEVEKAREVIAALRGDHHHVVEVRYRYQVDPGDGFRMRPGYINFQEVDEGEELANDHRGPIRAPESGSILMPLYQEQGEDGFFLVRPLAPAWLGLSAAVRRLHLERMVHLLPGVERHPTLEHGFRVDTRWARFLALELFHLLGFRRLGPRGRILTLYRRPHDG
ncbi:MAG: succinylglutamate desuccinylase/aspartoacylase family protein [Holophagales bacterium]|nr:succinylglutamate desuccinylase/aspartoacylase family protein [Holophagales bacterium]